MKNFTILLFLSVIATAVSACEYQNRASAAEISYAQTSSTEAMPFEEHAQRAYPRLASVKNENTDAADNNMEQKNMLVLSVNGIPQNISWENNSAVDELIACAQKNTILVNTTLYGGFEQVGDLPQSFSRGDSQITTEPGDIVLFSGNKLVLFFGSNSWSYTVLGHIEGLSTHELSELLDVDSAAVEIKIK